MFVSPPPPARVGAGQTYRHTFAVEGRDGALPPFAWETPIMPAWLTLTPNADGTQAVLTGTAPAAQGEAEVSIVVSKP